jgi:hypothetical protein
VFAFKWLTCAASEHFSDIIQSSKNLTNKISAGKTKNKWKWILRKTVGAMRLNYHLFLPIP